MNYKYHLLKYSGPSTRFTCPQCGRKHCFTPYVDAYDNIVGEEYGRCDHESSCGYCKYPPSTLDGRKLGSKCKMRAIRAVERFEPQQEPSGEICTIPRDIVKKTVRTEPLSDLLYYLCRLFDVETLINLIKEYLLGVTDDGDIIFYQVDQQGRCRTGKVMKYDRETGHRIKDSDIPGAITWMHSLLKQQGVLPKGWELAQCLFGEHLLKKYPEKPVCLVEAEKTALICAALMPQFVWVALGGKSQFGRKVDVLRGRQIIAFPDYDGYDTWSEKARERPYLNIYVSDYILRHATAEDKRIGADIADILVRSIPIRDVDVC